MAPRIGPRTEHAVLYVATHPGASKYEVAQQVGPRGSARYGNSTVLRAVKAA